MKLAAKLGMTTVFVALSVATIGANSAQAAFLGYYSTNNWKLNNTSADGSINTSAAPFQITLTGGDNQSGNLGTTDYTITADKLEQVNFSWNYSTLDYSSSNDPFLFLLNGQTTDIYNTTLDTGSGNFTTTVAPGDVFGFRVQTVDNLNGRATVTVSNFSATAIPESPATLGILMIGAAGALWQWKRTF